MMSEVFDAMWEAPLRTRGWVEFDPESGLVRFVGIQHGDTHLLTAYDTPRLRKQMHALGVRGYLAKPVELHELGALVQQVVAS